MPETECSCIVERVNVPELAKALKEGEEEAGRRARYRKLCEVAEAVNGKIAVAHHRDDNVETFLLNLIRGSGIRGLSGMCPVSEMGDCVVIRPLLEQSRTSIEKYLDEKGISCCTDETNSDAGYARNFLRLNVIPAMQKLNSKATEHICFAIEHLRKTEEYLEKETNIQAKKVVSVTERNVVINIPALEKQESVIAMRILYQALQAAAENSKDLTASHIHAVFELVKMQSGKKKRLPYGLEAIRQYDEIRIRKTGEDRKNEQPDMQIIKKEELAGEPVLELPDGKRMTFQLVSVTDANRERLIQKNIYTKAFDYDKIKGMVSMGEKVPGDIIFLRNGKKTLKKFFIDEKIPVDQRKTIVLRDEESVIWAVGFRISEKHKIMEQTKKALLVSVTNGGRHEYEH